MPKSPINKCMGLIKKVASKANKALSDINNNELLSLGAQMALASAGCPSPQLVLSAVSMASSLASGESDASLCSQFTSSALNGFVSSYGGMLGSMVDSGYGAKTIGDISREAVNAYTLSNLGVLDVRSTLAHFNNIALTLNNENGGNYGDIPMLSHVSGTLLPTAKDVLNLNVADIYPNLGKGLYNDVLSLDGNLNVNGVELPFIGSIPNPNFGEGSTGPLTMPLLFGNLGDKSLFDRLKDLLNDDTAGFSTMLNVDGAMAPFPLRGDIGLDGDTIKIDGNINNISQLIPTTLEKQAKFVKAVIMYTAKAATEQIIYIISEMRKTTDNMSSYIIKQSDLTVDSLGVRTDNFIDILKKSMCGRQGNVFLVPISILYALSIRGPYNPILYKQLAYLTYKMIEATGMSEIDVDNLTDSDMVIKNTILSGELDKTFKERTIQVIKNWYDVVLRKFRSHDEYFWWDICGLNYEGDACTTVRIFLDLQKINTSLSEQSDGAALRAEVSVDDSWVRKTLRTLWPTKFGIPVAKNLLPTYDIKITPGQRGKNTNRPILNQKDSIYILQTDFENLFDPDGDVSWDQTEDYCCLENETWDEIETILKDDKVNYATKAIIAHIIEYAELRVLSKEPTTIWDNQVALPVPTIPFPPPPTVFFPKNRIDFNKASGSNEMRNLIASWASMTEKSMQVGIAETIKDATLLANMVERYSPEISRQLRHKLKTLHPDVSKALETVDTLQDISEYVGAWLFGLEADKSNVLFDEWKSLPISIRTCLRPMVNKSCIEVAQTAFQRTNSLMYNVMAKTVGHGTVSPIVPNSVIVEIEDELIDQTKVKDKSSEKYTIIYVKRHLGGDRDNPTSYQIIGNKLGVSHANIVKQGLLRFKLQRDTVYYFIIGSRDRRTINTIIDVTNDYRRDQGLVTSENSYRISDGTTGTLSFNSDTLKELKKKYRWRLNKPILGDDVPQIQMMYRENETCDVNVHDIVQNLPPYLDLDKLYEEPSDIWSPFNYGYRCYYGSDGEYHMHIMRYSKGDDLRGEIEEEVDPCDWQKVDVDRQQYLYETYILPGLQGEYIGSDVVNSYIDPRILYSVELPEDRASMLYFPHDLYLYGDVEYRWFHMKYTIGGWGAMKGICEVIGKRIININYLYRVLNKVRQDYSSKWVICDDSVVEFTKTGHQSPKKFEKIDTEGIN